MMLKEFRMITRIWHGATPAAKSDEYLNLMRTIAIPDDRSTPGLFSAARATESLQQFGRLSHIRHSGIEPQIAAVSIKDDWHTVVDSGSHRIWQCRPTGASRSSKMSAVFSLKSPIPFATMSCACTSGCEKHGSSLADDSFGRSNSGCLRHLSRELSGFCARKVSRTKN
jgi:hypothetical protein